MPEKLTRHQSRMEPLLAELSAQNQLTPENLIFRSRSLFSRAYSNDIVGCEISPKEERKKSKEILYIDLSREGFYDALPDFLFHGPEEVSGYKNLEKRLNESEKAKEEEEAARFFFLPYEQEFYRQKIEIEAEERRMTSGFANPLQRLILEQFWTGIPLFDEASESVLFYLLPMAYKISGNHTLMSACFSTVLKTDVRMESVKSERVVFDDLYVAPLGACSLGTDMVTAGCLEEELPDLDVHIGPIDLYTLPEYLEDGKKRRLLEVLYSYFVPAEMDVRTFISLNQPADGFVFSEETATARLGYSTYI